MRFRLLGPLELYDGASWQGIGAGKCRSMLATLLIRADRVVSMDELAFELWGDQPPKTASTQLHGYVLRSRRALGDQDGTRLQTVAPGYRLALGDDDVDAQVFASTAARGDESLRAGDAERAAELLRSALGLWRGPALADVRATPLVATEAGRLAEQRLAVAEARVDADLDCGRHATLVAELRQLIAEHPFRERPWRQLMLALYRNGRQAEALEAYQELRRTLVDELGAEPCTETRQLHQRLLSGDPPPLPESVRLVPEPSRPICQLPAGVPDFTGRADQLATVTNALTDRSPDLPPPVVVVHGGPGVGKSTLTLQAARQVRGTFRDGQIYLDLAGVSDQPAVPATLLAEMLMAFGVGGAAIPDGVAARAALLRTLLADRQVLFVLDDAANAAQVRPLLPPDGGCAVLVSSRRVLTDLPGARHLPLDVLPADDGLRLFASIAGADRVTAEPAETAAILRACGHLPLAIRIAAGRLAGRPGWTLGVLRERLEDESRRLTELRLGDLGVRASFDLSLRLLPPTAAHAFRLLGLLGAQTFPGWVLGPLLDAEDTDDVLDLLVDTNLLRLESTDAIGQPRYRLHDLLRAYAVEGAAELPATERADALVRVLASWLELLGAAVDRLPLSLFRPAPGAAPRRALPERLSRPLLAKPLAWLEAERTSLRQAVQLSADAGLGSLAWEIAATAAAYYDQRSHYEDWRRTHETALRVVGSDAQGEAVLLIGLGQVQIYRDDYGAADANLRRAAHLFDQVGGWAGQGYAIASLGAIARIHGRYDEALEHATRGLELVMLAGDRQAEAQIRRGIGITHFRAGRNTEALDWFTEALALTRTLGDAHREAVVLAAMSPALDRAGDARRAVASLHRTIEIFDEIHDEQCAAQALLLLANLHADHGEEALARTALRRAGTIFVRHGCRIEEAKCWRLLGDLAPDRAEARRCWQRELRLWESIGMADEARIALDRLSSPALT